MRKSEVSTPHLLQLEINIDRVSAGRSHFLRNRCDLDYLPGRLEDGLIHDRIAARLGQREGTDGAVALNGDLEYRRKVVLVLGRDGGRLLPLAEETVVDERVVGVDRAGIGAIPAGATCTCPAPLGIQEGVLRFGVPLALSLAGGGLLSTAWFFLAGGGLLLSGLRF